MFCCAQYLISASVPRYPEGCFHILAVGAYPGVVLGPRHSTVVFGFSAHFPLHCAVETIIKGHFFAGAVVGFNFIQHFHTPGRNLGLLPGLLIQSVLHSAIDVQGLALLVEVVLDRQLPERKLN